MSSREIAELTGKRHDHVTRYIEVMLAQLGLDAPNFGDNYIDSMNRVSKQYRLSKDLTLTLVTKYDTPRRHAVVRRWFRSFTHAARHSAPSIFSTYCHRRSLSTYLLYSP